ncbi:MAG: MBL fold metallo-hydrolase [Myxococcota bacterium]|nr:MBL fold metallo-hydrolase [Myxococcota bacterium]
MTDGTLDLIDLPIDLPGYRQFLNCLVFKTDDLTFLVDPGPTASMGHLLETLDNLKIANIDYVLLTHIHLDHGGGTAKLLEKYPMARVYCHESGIRHMVDPTQLWLGSLKVLKEVGQLYGEPAPVPADRFASTEEIEDRGIRVIPTPGHAPHHISFLVQDMLFAGEAIGTHVDLNSGLPYLRPSTPPRFVLDVAIASLDRLLALEAEPAWVVFAHYGVADNVFSWCRRAKKQLAVWVETLRTLADAGMDDLEDRFFNRLMEIDPLFGRGRFDELPEDIKLRERSFLANTMAGMLGYIQSDTQKQQDR